MPGIISRYILKETVLTWLAVTAVLLLILVTNQFSEVLGDAAANRLPKDAVLLVMGLTSLQYLTILVPVALFLSIIMAFGRLYRDSEMAALMACGIGPLGLFRPLWLFCIALALLTGWVSLSVAPEAILKVQEIARQARSGADLRVVEAGRFVRLGSDDAVLYAETSGADGQLGKVFVQRRIDAQVEVIVAERAWQSESTTPGTRVLTFANGKRYEGEPGSSRFRILAFEEHGIPYALPEAEPREAEPETLPPATLLMRGDPAAVAELQWRLSVPLTLLVLALLAVPLSRSGPRQGRYSGMVSGVLIYIIYVNLLGAAKVWVEREQVPPVLGLWWVHGAFALVAVLLLMQQHGRLPRLVLPVRQEADA